MTALSSEFVSDFVDFLRGIRDEYANANDPVIKRRWWIEELKVLRRMAREVDPALDREGLLFPLIDLIVSLESLDFGATEPSLQRVRLKHRPPAPRAALFRARAAAASELLMRNGATASDADSWVARCLSREKYEKPGKSADPRITAATIKGWRKAAREGRPGDLMRAEFNNWLDNEGRREELMRLVAPMYTTILYLDRVKPPPNVRVSKMLPSVCLMELIFSESPPSDALKK